MQEKEKYNKTITENEEILKNKNEELNQEK